MATDQVPAVLKGFILGKLRAFAVTKAQLARQHAEIASIMARSRQTAVRVEGFTVTCVPAGTQTRLNPDTLTRLGVARATITAATEQIPRAGYTQIRCPGDGLR